MGSGVRNGIKEAFIGKGGSMEDEESGSLSRTGG